MLEKIKKICFNIATLGGVGELVFGGVAATIAVIPVLLLLNALAFLGPMFLYMATIVLTLGVIFIIHMALYFESDQNASAIVLDRLFGLVVAFLGIPFSFKFVLVGLVLFNILNFFRPFLLVKLVNLNLDELPGVLGILIGDVVVGLVLNVFFRFVLWLAR